MLKIGADDPDVVSLAARVARGSSPGRMLTATGEPKVIPAPFQGVARGRGLPPPHPMEYVFFRL